MYANTYIYVPRLDKIFGQAFLRNVAYRLFFREEIVSWVYCMEDGGVDRTVIDCRQNQLGQTADFPALLIF